MQLSPNTYLQNGKYRIVRFIAGGGFGYTYEGEHVLLHKRVAIKEFFISDFCNRDEETQRVGVGATAKSELVERLQSKFVDEARSICRYKHPGIVDVSDVFEENGTAYFVMDYIDGPSLDMLVKQNGPMAEDRALRYICLAAQALKPVHESNRLHLDIKPGNIMIDENDNPVLIDFGASKQYDEVGTENTSTLLGRTPGYAPPEQMGNSVATFTPATDIYALGATLFKLLTGVTPPDATQLISGTPMPQLPNYISGPTRNAIMRSMSLNKAQRPQSIDAFRAIFDEPAMQTAPAGGSDDEKTQYAGSSEPSAPMTPPGQPQAPIHPQPQPMMGQPMGMGPGAPMGPQGPQGPQGPMGPVGQQPPYGNPYQQAPFGQAKKGMPGWLWVAIIVGALVLAGVVAMLIGGGGKTVTADTSQLNVVEETSYSSGIGEGALVENVKVKYGVKEDDVEGLEIIFDLTVRDMVGRSVYPKIYLRDSGRSSLRDGSDDWITKRGTVVTPNTGEQTFKGMKVFIPYSLIPRLDSDLMFDITIYKESNNSSVTDYQYLIMPESAEIGRSSEEAVTEVVEEAVEEEVTSGTSSASVFGLSTEQNVTRGGKRGMLIKYKYKVNNYRGMTKAKIYMRDSSGSLMYGSGDELISVEGNRERIRRSGQTVSGSVFIPYSMLTERGNIGYDVTIFDDDSNIIEDSQNHRVNVPY